MKSRLQNRSLQRRASSIGRSIMAVYYWLQNGIRQQLLPTQWL